MDNTAKSLTLNKQNEIFASFILKDYREPISDLVIAYLKKDKTFSKLFKEVLKIVNSFSKGETHKSGCSEIIAVMLLNTSFYYALDALGEKEPEPRIFLSPGQ